MERLTRGRRGVDKDGNLDPRHKIIGKQVTKYRKLAAKSQEDLASDLNMSFQQIQKYESGENRITGLTLWDIAQALHCKVADLYRGLTVTEPEGGGIKPDRWLLSVMRTCAGFDDRKRKLLSRYLHTLKDQ